MCRSVYPTPAADPIACRHARENCSRAVIISYREDPRHTDNTGLSWAVNRNEACVYNVERVTSQ